MYGIKQSESNEDLFDLCMVTYSDDITNPDFFVKLDDVFDSLMGDTEGSFKILGKEYYIPFYSRIKRIFIITKTTSRERVSGRLYGSSVKDQSEYQCFSMTFEKKDINDINDNYLYFEDFDKKKDFQELYETKAEKKFLFKKTDGWYIIIQLKYVDKTQDNTSIKRYFPMNKFETSFLPTISVFDATNKYLNKNVNTSLGKMKEGLSRKIGKQIGNQIASIKDTNIFNVDEPKAQKLPEGDFVNNVNSQLESLGNSIKTR
jgi:hypothetical protein